MPLINSALKLFGVKIARFSLSFVLKCLFLMQVFPNRWAIFPMLSPNFALVFNLVISSGLRLQTTFAPSPWIFWTRVRVLLNILCFPIENPNTYRIYKKRKKSKLYPKTLYRDVFRFQWFVKTPLSSFVPILYKNVLGYFPLRCFAPSVGPLYRI